MRPPRVDDIMKKPVYYVDTTETVEEAVQKMLDYGTKKILVKDGNKPKGILEKWMITGGDLKSGRKAGDMDLRKFEKVPVGTDLFDIKERIMNSAAVYIHEPDNPDELVGVITTYDLVRAI